MGIEVPNTTSPAEKPDEEELEGGGITKSASGEQKGAPEAKEEKERREREAVSSEEFKRAVEDIAYAAVDSYVIGEEERESGRSLRRLRIGKGKI